ncbi:hypothetical protein GCM10019060_39810 [Novosphingobium pokkalii]|nr:hypothetical protein GCM10019060_39810 [Novosphingobium pokkalii]
MADRCSSGAMVYRSKSDETIVNVSDDPFRPLLANPDSSDFQPALEAYRRCLTRKIAAIRATPTYALAPDTPDRDCPNCGLYLSNRALEIPRLRMIIGLTYLAPPRFADQDPAAALAILRQAATDATRVVSDFRDQAQTVIEARQEAIQDKRNAAIRASNRRAQNAMLIGLMGTAVGLASGMNGQQINDSVGTVTLNELNQANADLGARLTEIDNLAAQVRQRRNVVFSDSAAGWQDDGIRVTVARYLPIEADGDDNVQAPSTGALSNLLPLRYLVQISIDRNGESYQCTGAFVAPRLVLTARHCIEDVEHHTGVAPAALTVRWLNYVSGKGGLKSDPMTFSVVHWTTTALSEPRDHTNDWAFLVTDKPFGGGDGMTLIPPAELAKHPAMRVALAGYSIDLNDGDELTMDWGCPARWRYGTLFFTCRDWQGSSGGPVFAVDGTFARMGVVGVNDAILAGAGDGVARMKVASASQGL